MRRAAGLIIIAASTLCGCAPRQHTWDNFKSDIATCWMHWPEYGVVEKFGSTLVSPICVPGQTIKFVVAPGSDREEPGDIASIPPKPPATAPTVDGSTVDAEYSAVSEPERSHWEVQVGAVRDSAAADALAQPLRDRGYRVRICSPNGEDDWYRVRITNLPTRAEAKTLAGRLSRDQYPGAWVPRAP